MKELIVQKYILLEREISGEIETNCHVYLPVTTSLRIRI